MLNIFTKEFNLRTSDFACNKCIQPSAVLDLFQTVAGEHANLLGCGFDDLIKKGLLWVVVKTKYEVIKQPEFYGAIKVKTWPLPASRISFQREYLIENESGEPLIRGTSDWVVMDCVSRKLAFAKDIYPEMEFCNEKLFDGRLPRIPDFEARNSGYTVIPKFSQIDRNNHLNNTKYLNFALDSTDIKSNEEIVSVQIEFKHEVLKDTELKVYSVRCEDGFLCKGISDDEIKFTCKIETK